MIFIMAKQRIIIDEPFQLERGGALPRLELAFHTCGKRSPGSDNVVWIYHALTGNSDPATWWPDIVGEGKAIDTRKYFVVCVNVPGSCYGSTGPLSLNHATGIPYYNEFPKITIRDMTRAFRYVRKELGIDRIALAVGASLGGQQALEAAIEEPELFERLVLIATNPKHSPWGIAWNAAQRMAIEADGTMQQGRASSGRAGLAAARAIAMLSYRSYELYGTTQDRTENDADLPEVFRADSYQRYQGEKLVRRFNPFSYLALSHAMDSHDVGRGRGNIESALTRVTAETTVIGITSDGLFPVKEQRYLAENIPEAVYHEIQSPYGHDGFLIEGEKVGGFITNVLSRKQELAEIQ